VVNFSMVGEGGRLGWAGWRFGLANALLRATERPQLLKHFTQCSQLLFAVSLETAPN
jgi:hypothetical protein